MHTQRHAPPQPPPPPPAPPRRSRRGGALSQAGVGLSQGGKYNFARNFTSPTLNYLTCNNGYHTIHHLYPGTQISPMRPEHPGLARPLKRCLLLFGHPCRLFLGPEFWLVARWNRLGEPVKTRKKREKTRGKWARYGLKSAKEEGMTTSTDVLVEADRDRDRRASAQQQPEKGACPQGRAGASSST